LRNFDEKQNLFSRLMQGFKGIRTTEYSMLVGFISVLALVLFTYLGVKLYNLYNMIGNNMP